MNSQPTIAFFGLFGVGNFGNEASLRAARESIAAMAPDAKLICICESPGRVTAEHGLPAYSNKIAGPLDRVILNGRAARLALRPLKEVARLWASWRLLRKVDAVVVPGTGILDDFGVRPWQMPYELFRWSLICRLTRTRLVYLSIGAGPIHNRTSRWLMKSALRFADYVSYRDQRSRAYMAGIGRDVSRDCIFPDLAFSLPAPRAADQPPEARSLNVGIGVMAYNGWTGRDRRAEAIFSTYFAALLDLCRFLLAQGHRLTVILGDDYDRPVADELVAALQAEPAPAAAGVQAPPLHAYNDVMTAISETDVVVATRFHNVVAALMMCRPVVSLGYAAKNQDLLEAMGVPGSSQHIEGFDPSAAVQQVAAAAARSVEIRDLLLEANRAAESRLAEQYALVGPLLGLARETPTPTHAPTRQETEAHV